MNPVIGLLGIALRGTCRLAAKVLPMRWIIGPVRRLTSALTPRGCRAYPFTGGWIYLDVVEDPAMSKIVLGLFERNKTRAMRRLLRPGMTFVDVGAHKGYFSLMAARLMGSTGRVLSFEPHPENAGALRRSAAANGYGCIEVHEVALSDANGTAGLNVGKQSAWHTLVSGQEGRDLGVIEVPTRTLDSFLEEAGRPAVDLMKIDVEGADLAVLRGARATFERNPDLVLLMDIHPALGVRPAEVAEALGDMGFVSRNIRRPHRPVVCTDGHPRQILASRPDAVP